MAYDNFTVPSVPKNSEENRSLSTFDHVIESIAALAFTYYTPVLISSGLIGNMLSLFIFCISKLRMQSTRIYLSALAISDTCFLLQLLPPWLSAMEITTLFYKPHYCQLFVFTSYVSSCLSGWLVVAFTVERFVAVVYPLKRNIMCTVARAKYIVVIVVFCALSLNSPLIIFASPSVNDCNIDFDYMDHAARFNLADTIVSFSFPLAIVVFLNILIMVNLYRAHRARRALQAQQETETEVRWPRTTRWNRRSPSLPSIPMPPPPPRAQHIITRMLLIVSSVYVVLNVPAYTMRILAYANDMSTAEYTGRWAAMQQIALTFFNTNFGINFFLYCLTGQNFRRALCQTLPCLRFARAHRRVNALRLTSRNPRNAARVNSITVSCTSAPETNATVAPVLVSGEAARRHYSDPAIEQRTRNNSRHQRNQFTESSMEAADAPAPASHI